MPDKNDKPMNIEDALKKSREIMEGKAVPVKDLTDTILQKPPIGVYPEKLFEEDRIKDLALAISKNANYNRMKTWATEIQRRLDYLIGIGE